MSSSSVAAQAAVPPGTGPDARPRARLALRHMAPDALVVSAQAPLLGAALIGEAAVAAGELPLARVPLHPLAGGPCVEAWQVPGVTGRATIGAVRCAWNDQFLFGAIDPRAIAAAPLQATTRATYDALFAALRDTGFPYLLRAWNYMPAINREAGEPDGLERYRQFNLGRVAAFEAARAPIHEGAPAACALGTDSGDLVVYFLAMRRAPVAIENPRQVSAYRYPTRYGPRAPTFSRAALVPPSAAGEAPHLFISGTASIVGYQTVHIGDVAAQTRETLANIAAVVDATRARLEDPLALPLSAFSYKAYVRHPPDLPAVQREVRAALGEAVEVLYLQADICRADLLVEIEAFA